MSPSKSIIMLRSNDVSADSRIQKESRTLKESNYRVRIVGWDRGLDHPPCERFDDAIRTEVTLLGVKASYSGGLRKNFFPLMRFQVKLASQLVKRRNEYSCIHACDFDTAFVACMVNVFLKKKFVYDIFDYYVDAFNVPFAIKPMIAKFDRWVMKRADKVIVCNEGRREQICFPDQGKVFVIHNSPQIVHAADDSLVFDGLCGVSIVYVGVFAPGRLIEELLETVEERHDICLHIAGFGALEDRVKAAATRCCRIRFYGKLAYEDALKLESKADIMIALYDPSCSNHKYAAPNKFYEALMLGKPLITTKGIGVDDVVEREDFGVAVNYSKKDLSEGIDTLLEMMHKGRINVSEMKMIFERDYCWDRMADRLLSIYATLEN